MSDPLAALFAKKPQPPTSETTQSSEKSGTLGANIPSGVPPSQPLSPTLKEKDPKSLEPSLIIPPLSTTPPIIIPPTLAPQEISIPSPSPIFSSPTTPIDEKFDVREAEPFSKVVFTVYGHKGHGKTVAAFLLDGTIRCLSFDNKSVPIWAEYFGRDSRIKVYNAVQHQDASSPQKYLASSEKTFRFINYLLDSFKPDPPDWIIFDGAENLELIAEMTMRFRNNLMPFEGFKNLNLWKERKLNLLQIHRKAFDIARKGIVYTTYVEKDEVMVDGEFKAKVDVPKWVGVILQETDVVMRVTSRLEKLARHYAIEVESSKVRAYPTGKVYDFTDAKSFEALRR